MTAFHIRTHQSGGICVAALSGALDEAASLTPLASLTGPVELNLRGIDRINWAGTRAWVAALTHLASQAQVVFVECAPIVIRRLSLVPEFLRGGMVRSFYAPMCCSRCRAEREHLFVTREWEHRRPLPWVHCSACGEVLDLDVEDQVLGFLSLPHLASMTRSQRIRRLDDLA